MPRKASSLILITANAEVSYRKAVTRANTSGKMNSVGIVKPV